MNWRTIITVIGIAALICGIYFNLTTTSHYMINGVLTPVGALFLVIGCVCLIIIKQMNKKE